MVDEDWHPPLNDPLWLDLKPVQAVRTRERTRMKTVKVSDVGGLILILLGLAAGVPTEASAQTLTTLYSFPATCGCRELRPRVFGPMHRSAQSRHQLDHRECDDRVDRAAAPLVRTSAAFGRGSRSTSSSTADDATRRP
jgi:hypothetical protein